LKPYIERGDIKVVFDDWVEDWKPENARRLMENALTRNNDNVQAVVAPNDGTAGGIIQALKSRNLAGKVLVSGQDADLAACQRVVEGVQAMTVYKPIHALSRAAAEITVAVARGEDISSRINNAVNNKKIDVPSVLIPPIQVDIDNMMETVIKDGFHAFEDVYRNVPFDQRPPKP
jgi:D-xylose transport system substrate-binding protein